MNTKKFLLTLLPFLLAGCAAASIAGLEKNSLLTNDTETAPITASDSIHSEDETVVTNPTATLEPAEDESGSNSPSNPDDITRPPGWEEDSHGDEVDPNYEVVFPQDRVNRLDITIEPQDWATMMSDMTALYGEFGQQPAGRTPPEGDSAFRQDGRPSPPQGQPPQDGAVPEQGMPPDGGRPPEGSRPAMGGMGPGGMMEGDENNPTWVTATVEFEGQTWSQVGIRFKGNSSLFSSWRSGNLKLPLKLDFDQFEDQYPEVDDQRFYGFKQLSLASNFHDDSFLREKVTADIFRSAGVPAAQTAFYQVFIDYGEGPIYFGLYTMVEVVDDTLIETQFTDDSGNVYKPSGRGASFASGTFDPASFDKETNQDQADWSDVESLYQALQAPTRTSNPESWRAGLEAVFDVDGFLNWLAVNTIIQNWDSYGTIAHNYYLYNDPTTEKLTWIPWDHNEALQDGNRREALSLSLDEVGEEWPLIRYLLDDAHYQAVYAAYVENAINTAFNPESLISRYQVLHELIEPYVSGSNGEINGYTNLSSPAAFEASLPELIQHTKNRFEAAQDYLRSLD